NEPAVPTLTIAEGVQLCRLRRQETSTRAALRSSAGTHLHVVTKWRICSPPLHLSLLFSALKALLICLPGPIFAYFSIHLRYCHSLTPDPSGPFIIPSIRLERLFRDSSCRLEFT
ncbi:hypothetical protein JAAARDRAFT_34293, partial [Jaapia argillacea MUCL 33604]